MSISGPFIKRPIATSLLMLALLLTGILAYQLLPVSSLPEVEYPTIQVVTFYPGASPDVMASSVTAPLEKQFGQMPGLDQMTSTSSNSSSIIALQFSLDMSLDVAEQQVQAAINAATSYLPADLPNPPIYSKVNPADTPILTLALTSKTMPLTQVEDYADTRLVQKISEQSGVGLVNISGGQRPAVRVQMNPDALTAYGLTLETIRNAIMTANINAAKGNFDGKRLSYTINSNDQLLSSSDYKPLIIAYRNNAPVRLSDIANVIDGAENTQLAAWMNKTPAIILNIQRQPGANVIEVADRVKLLLDKIRLNIPRAINISLLADRTITIRASVADVQFDLLYGLLLVVLVIFIFLRHFAATIIPSIAVPLSLIGTLGVMYLLGYGLNNLTLMALTIATGFLADDAIVMIENIARYVEQGEPPFEAALKGAAQIGFTIISLTVSLIAVLIPLLFMSDVIGRLFREFAVTLAVTILISAFISLSLTPMLCARLLRQHKSNEVKPLEQKALAIQKSIIDYYGNSLRWVLEHQTFTLLVAVFTLFLTAILFYSIPKGFFPIQDTGFIQGISEAAQSASFQSMVKDQQALGNLVLKDPAVDNISSFIGIDGTNVTLNSGRILIALKSISNRGETALHIMQRLQPQLTQVPGARLYMQPVQDLTVDTIVSRNQYQYTLSSTDANQVSQWTEKLMDKLRQLPELSDVTSNLQDKGLQTSVIFDRDTASRLGITAQQIDDTLYDAYGQRQVSIMFTQRNQYRVVLEILPKLQQEPLSLNHIYFNSIITNTPSSSASTPTSTSSAQATYQSNTSFTQIGNTSLNSSSTPIPNIVVPLSTFVTIKQGNAPLVINRLGQFPSATISFNLAPGASLGAAITAVNEASEDLHIPNNVITGFAGSAKIFKQSLLNEGWLLLASIIAVYIILGILYESYIHPITILSTLPSASVGALLALMITGKELTVISLIGIILLIGIVMKNAIIMIDFALEQERQYAKEPDEAIYEAALLRFRPILMTSMAAIFGAIPLAIGTGMGAELRQPLGIAIIGGLMLSQLLTLYTTPVIYLAFDRHYRRMKTWRVKLRWTNRPSFNEE